MFNSIKILWACMIYNGDIDWLDDYIIALNKLTIKPDEIRFFISGDSHKCMERISKETGIFSYQVRSFNDGFNKSFNLAVEYAIKHNFEWLITMSVRCRPASDWIEKLKIDELPEDIGMITTLTLANSMNGKTFNLGHFCTPAGACHEYGEGLDVSTVEDYSNKNPDSIIGPCSGAAAYRLKALRNNGIFTGTDVVNSSLFKFYNCDGIAYLVLVNGYKNIINTHSQSYKVDLKKSTSHNPDSCGLKVHMEISRVANILTYFTNHKDSLDRYIAERSDKYKSIDLNIIVLLAKSFKREFPKDKLDEILSSHMNLSQSTKNWYKYKQRGLRKCIQK